MRPHRQHHRSRGHRSGSTSQDQGNGYSSDYHQYERYSNTRMRDYHQQDGVGYNGWGGTAYHGAVGGWGPYAASYAGQDYSYEYDAQSYYPDHSTYDYNHDYDYSYRRRSPRSDNRNRDQRRNYHSSSRRRSPNEGPSERGAAAGDGAGSSGSSFTGRLFQHLDREGAAPSYTYHSVHPRAYNHRTGNLASRLSPRPSERVEKKKLGPDEAYLAASLEHSQRLLEEDTLDTGVGEEDRGLVRKLLVLDLNGTLVYRSPHPSHRGRDWNRGRDPAAGEEQRQPDDVYAQFDPSQPRPLRSVHPRPYLVPFCTFLLHPDTKRWLDTMVWSSAQPHSVRDMVEKCFGERKNELVGIWARDKFGLSQGDYGRKVQTTKDLSKPWEELAPTGSGLSTAKQKQKHSAKTTLLLDDSPLKAHLQPYNHLCIKEYDVEMRRTDIGLRELEVARTKYAGVLEGKEEIEDVLKKTKKRRAAAVEGGEEEIDANDDNEVGTRGVTSERKRKRKEKKENNKKEKIEQQIKKLTEECEGPAAVYDETLLAVVGILDAAKRESNVAAWIRSGGLIDSLSATGGDEAQVTSRGGSPLPEGSVSSAISASSTGSPRKKLRLNGAGSTAVQEEVLASVSESLPSEDAPPVSSSPFRESSPAETETEKTGVPLVENQNAEAQLWFDHPGMLAHWASRGRKVLGEMEIEVVSGVIVPTG